jgi:hypothetical protein
MKKHFYKVLNVEVKSKGFAGESERDGVAAFCGERGEG